MTIKGLFYSEGSIINGVRIDEILIERICCEYTVPTSIYCSMDFEGAVWMFHIGVFKSGGSFYLFLDLNDQCSSVEFLIERNDCPNTGFVEISENIACDFITKLNDFGKEAFANISTSFAIFIEVLTSTIPCKVRFIPMLGGRRGAYVPSERTIYVATNQSQFAALYSLIHEYVHYILDCKKYNRNTIIKTVRDYILDDEERICNSVAMLVLDEVFHDFVDSILLNCKEEKYFFDELSDEQIVIEGYINTKFLIDNTERKMKRLIYSIKKMILKAFNEKIRRGFKIEKEQFVQSGLVQLSRDDNRLLYDLIINEVSPLMTNDID